MDNNIIVALLSCGGTVAGAFLGVMASARLTNYRLEQLEKKVEKHNNTIDRTYRLEQWAGITDEKLKVANHRIDDLEKGVS